MLMRRYGGPLSSRREMQRLRRRMNRLLSDWPTSQTEWSAASYPAINVWTNEDGGIVTAELPGVDPEALDISVQNGTLTLRGICERREAQEGETWHRRERGCGAFARTVQLPFQVAPEGVEATFEKGVLTIELPRAQEDKPKKITIQAG